MTDDPSFFQAFAAQRQDRTPAATAITPTGPGSDGAPVEISNPAGYVDAALTRETSEVTNEAEGGRNDRLNTAAFNLARLIAAGLPLTENQVVDALTAAARTVGLTPSETAGTIRSGMRGGARHPLAWTAAPTVQPARPFLIVNQPADTPGEPDDERSSWWLRNAASRNDETEEPQPSLLYRTDGVALAYAGKVNALIGESESGKTWVALEAIRQVLADGGVVGMLDFEDSYSGIRSRLTHMGITGEALTRFYYCSPDESLTQTARDDLAEFLTGRQPALVVVDGVNAAMTLLGMDLQDNTDATKFTRELLRPLTALGAGVITVDHVTKNRDARGNYAIGAQAKRADINGAALIVEVIAPFGRGMTGRLKISVSKDRPGHVRAVAAQAKHAAEAVIASSDAGDVKVDLYGLTIDDVDPVTEVMEAISQLLETVTGDDTPTSIKALASAVGRRQDTVRLAEQRLTQAGHIDRPDKVWELVRPFRRRGPNAAEPFTSPIDPGSIPTAPGSHGGKAPNSAPALPPPSGSGAAPTPKATG